MNGQTSGAYECEATLELEKLRKRKRPSVTVTIQRQKNGTYTCGLPGGQTVPVSRKERRAIDAEARRKQKREHVRR